MTTVQTPLLLPGRAPNATRRAAPALFLWRARNGLATPLTPNAVVDYSGLQPYPRMGKGPNGQLVTVSRHQPRAWMVDLDGDGFCETPALAIADHGAVNYALYSEDFTNWTAVNSPAILTPTITLGELVLSLLNDDSGVNQEAYSRAVAANSLSATPVLSFFVAKGHVNSATGSRVLVNDGTNRAQVTITWNGNVPIATVATGTLIGQEYFGTYTYLTPSTNVLATVQVWRITVRCTGFVAANANTIQVQPAATAAQQGSEFYGGFSLTDRVAAYRKTTSASLNANGGDAWVATWDGAPEAFTLAARLVFMGETYFPSGQSGALVTISDASGGQPALSIGLGDASGGAFYTAKLNQTAGNVTVAQATTPALGDVVTLRVSVSADGLVTFGQTINGGVETAVVAGSRFGLPAAWSTPTKIRLVGQSGANGLTALLALGVFAGAPSAAYIDRVLA